MKIAMFNDAWFADIIEQYTPESKDVDDNTAALVRGMLVSASIVAQSLEELARAIREKP